MDFFLLHLIFNFTTPNIYSAHSAKGLVRYLTAYSTEKVFLYTSLRTAQKTFLYYIIPNILYKYFFQFLIVSQVDHVCF